MPMPNDQFYNIVGAMFNKCLEVLAQKGHDYAAEDNRLRNFEEDARDMSVPTWVVIRIFAQKHMKAIRTFRETGKVESEAPEMRYVDFINYLLLDFADAVANGGYEPQEEWLRNALEFEKADSDIVLQFGRKAGSALAGPDEPIPPVTVAHVPKGKEGDEAVDVCCNPGGEDCCDEGPDSG